MQRTILNFVLSQGQWAVCVWAAAAGHPLLAVPTAILVVGVHLFGRPRECRVRELTVLLLISLAGMLLDVGLSAAGLISLVGERGPSVSLAAWLFSLWLGFTTTLNGSLGLLLSRWWLAAIVGAVFGPVAYLAGMKLGAVRLHDTIWYSIVAIAIEWGIGLPLMISAATMARPRVSDATASGTR
jgi:hypothetical protein